jgi:iron complex transport system substrate-binding protein
MFRKKYPSDWHKLRRTRPFFRNLVLFLVLSLSGRSEAEVLAPSRVVSLNVCTDQLAMLVAAPGQLVAVSHLAREPQSSAMVNEAYAFPATTGTAEDVFRLKPDLVLAGVYTTPIALDLLERLHIRVERFESAWRVEAVSADLRRMGRLLGQVAKAEALARSVERRLADLMADTDNHPPIRAVFLDANSYTAGIRTLMHSLMTVAGLSNVAVERGLVNTTRLSLEDLVLAKPQLVLVPERYHRPSQGEAILDHPAVRRLTGHPLTAQISGAAAACATPASITTAEQLAAARRTLRQASGRQHE